MIMMESRFCAGHGSQCCVWIFSFSAYQIKTPIDGGTEAAWGQKGSFPGAAELMRVTVSVTPYWR